MEKTIKNLIICLVGGLLFHYFFYGKGLGISYPLYVAFLYLIFYLRVSAKGKKQSVFDVLLFGSALLLACSFALFSNGIMLALNFLLVPMLIFIHMNHSKRWNQEKWSNRLFIRAMFLTFFETVHQFFYQFGYLNKVGKGVMQDNSYQTLKKVFIGFVISVPLLWTIIYLLMSSDQHFQQLLGKLPMWLYHANVGSFLFQISIVLFISLSLFAYFITLSKPLDMKEEHESHEIKMDRVIVSTILLLLNAVYFLYTAVQFTYFFNGDPSSATMNYTYAEYARRGFSELTIIALINLGLLFLLTHVRRFQQDTLPKIIKLLLSILVIFTMIMLTSAFYRLSLYEQAYGYTYSRVYAHLFMILLSILLVLAMFKIYKQTFKLLRAMSIATLIVYVVVNYVNIDQFIVSQNMKRYSETEKLDVDYLAVLSYEAIPDLIEQDNDLFKEILQEKANELNGQSIKWQSFNLSKDKAKRMLDEWVRNGSVN